MSSLCGVMTPASPMTPWAREAEGAAREDMSDAAAALLPAELGVGRHARGEEVDEEVPLDPAPAGSSQTLLAYLGLGLGRGPHPLATLVQLEIHPGPLLKG
jgi:hypothetical protein